MTLRCLAYACALALMASDPIAASAQSAGEEAQEAFARGMQHAQQAAWEQAAQAFRESNALEARAGTLQNLIVALLELGQGPAALASIEEYLATYHDEALDSIRAHLGRLRQDLKREVATLRVASSPAHARLEVLRDGEATAAVVTRDASGRTLWLEPGQYTLRLTQLGFEPFEQTVHAVAGEQAELDVQLSPPPMTASAAEPPARPSVAASAAAESIASLPSEASHATAVAKPEKALVRKWWVWACAAVVVGVAAGLAAALTTPDTRVQAPLGPEGEIERL